MDKDKFRRLVWAVYFFIAALAIILFLLSFRILNDLYRGLLLGLSAQLLGVALLFFLLQFFRREPEEVLQEQMDEMGSYLNEMKQFRDRLGDIDIYPTRQSIWDESLKSIKSGQWEKLRIFAPVGLWCVDQSKIDWLKEVAVCATPGFSQQVRTILAVYGLPPKSRYGEKRPINEVIEDLQYFRKVLNVFSSLDNVALHYYPPAASSVGIGAVIVENTARTGGIVAFAMASHGHEELVDAGFGLDDRLKKQSELFFLARAWFDDKIFSVATGNFILHDVAQPIERRWPDIVTLWYPEVKRYYCAETNECISVTSQLEGSCS